MQRKEGYSLIELLIGLVLASVVSMAAYRVTTVTHRRGTQSVKEMRSTQEVNKVLDRISSEIENAISLNNSRNSMLASMVSDGVDSSCRGYKIDLPGGTSKELIPHGLIPIPGATVEDIDLLNQMTYSDPHLNTFTNEDSDALRILYIPLESKPIRIRSFDGASQMITIDPIAGETLNQLIPTGSYVIVSDKTKRELYRATGSSVGMYWYVNFSFISIWNMAHQNLTYGKYNEIFDSSAVAQTVKLVTYAFDPETQQLFRDDHQYDDAFDPAKQNFPSNNPLRIPHWTVVAKNIGSFHVQYQVTTSEKDSTLITTHTPIASLMQSRCPAQIGYPLFRSVSIDITTVDQNPDAHLQINSFSRRATSRNLLRPAGASDSSDDGDPIIVTGLPIPPPSGGSPATPPLPGRSF